MFFDFSEAERNTTRHALDVYVSDLREEIVETEKYERREAPALGATDPRRRDRATE